MAFVWAGCGPGLMLASPVERSRVTLHHTRHRLCNLLWYSLPVLPSSEGESSAGIRELQKRSDKQVFSSVLCKDWGRDLVLGSSLLRRRKASSRQAETTPPIFSHIL